MDETNEVKIARLEEQLKASATALLLAQQGNRAFTAAVVAIILSMISDVLILVRFFH